MSYYANRRNMPIGPPQALPLRRTVPVNGLGAYYANRRNMPIGPPQSLPLRPVSGLGATPAPGMCPDGSAWMPMEDPQHPGRMKPVCERDIRSRLRSGWRPMNWDARRYGWECGFKCGDYCRPIGALGQACPPCTIWNGAACVPCPPGAEGIPECEGCENGQLVEAEPGFFERSAFWGPVLIGTITALTSAVALGYVLGQR